MAGIGDELAEPTVVDLEPVEHRVHRRRQFRDLVAGAGLGHPFVQVAAGDGAHLAGDGVHGAERAAGQQPRERPAEDHEHRHAHPDDRSDAVEPAVDVGHVGEHHELGVVDRAGAEHQRRRVAHVLEVVLVDPDREHVVDIEVDGDEEEFVDPRLRNDRRIRLVERFGPFEGERLGVELHDLPEVGEDLDRLTRLVVRGVEEPIERLGPDQLTEREREVLELGLDAEVVDEDRLAAIEQELAVLVVELTFEDGDLATELDQLRDDVELLLSRRVELVGHELLLDLIEPEGRGDHAEQERDEHDQARQPRPDREVHHGAVT